MEKRVDYTILDKISIQDYDLIVPVYTNIHQFCIRNNINTLGDLIRKFDNNELEFKNNSFKEELFGFVDFVRYRHFGIKLPHDELLNEVITFVPNSNKGEYHAILDDVSYNSVFKNSLRRLGFTSKETDELEYFVKKQKQSMVIIDVLYNYNRFQTSSFGYKGMKEILEKKLEIYIKYYEKYLKPYNSFETKIFIEIDILLRRLKNLKDKRRVIDLLIEETQNEITKNSKFVNEEKIKKLIKKYEGK